MVIAGLHALGLAVPLVVAVSTALAAQNGLLIRNRIFFEKARNIQAIIFDKTGTLTELGLPMLLNYRRKWMKSRSWHIPAVGAVFMSASTVIVSINARLFKI